ncbi:2-C-methyl-D-erythritol 4-phosphate cytidylyltransferase [Corynebacterium sp. zg254]|uniref:2-C-methyl-D-erythritol 4-phosphate cytidylyltransferase n=1 Tax=Corynebacterium zhongnanshanii TaxID=2768834 RepID=A0ABQ6VC83_9CORY|nr:MULTISPECIES: 2-C-methyl-D-erythritol 4-phosphate cytidylyltransferase [Corynebacterium]KAB3519832.1 2-C-methyl-D-erythritol 4-phosphate cytidylyltransferase [Corynebacterium zhongnanshanii]MCR5914764.1 2-C-methyl-D-erythritol 4-phosphate cytidylyltransferase [Corynebacterium sp. zg254]
MSVRTLALIAAAGSGTRLGFSTPKAFVELAGRTLLERSLDLIHDAHRVSHTLVIASADMMPRAQALLDNPENLRRWQGMRVGLVRGGRERVDSVYQGLLALEREYGRDDSLVLIHDAARCLTPSSMVAGVVDHATDVLARGTAVGAIPVVPVADTIKVVEQGQVVSTPPRESLRAVQTPQGFALDRLLEANEAYQASAGPLATDDASLMEMAGLPVSVVDGDARAMKITTPSDYRMAQLLLEER